MMAGRGITHHEGREGITHHDGRRSIPTMMAGGVYPPLYTQGGGNNPPLYTQGGGNNPPWEQKGSIPTMGAGSTPTNREQGVHLPTGSREAYISNMEPGRRIYPTGKLGWSINTPREARMEH